MTYELEYLANHLIGLITHCKVCYATDCYVEEFLHIYYGQIKPIGLI